MLLLCPFYWWGNWEPKQTFLSSLSCVHAEPSTQSSARSVDTGHTPLHCHLWRAGLRHVSHLTPTVHQDLLKWESELVNFLLAQEFGSCISCTCPHVLRDGCSVWPWPPACQGPSHPSRHLLLLFIPPGPSPDTHTMEHEPSIFSALAMATLAKILEP